jgi:hypothetical protein
MSIYVLITILESLTDRSQQDLHVESAATDKLRVYWKEDHKKKEYAYIDLQSRTVKLVGPAVSHYLLGHSADVE